MDKSFRKQKSSLYKRSVEKEEWTIKKITQIKV